MKNTVLNFISIQTPSLNNFEPIQDRELSTIKAKMILSDIMNFRRVPEIKHSCSGVKCSDCSSIHLPKIISAVRTNRPISFVLPAFPGKSPNSNKVLGPLPDLAEQLSLQFLESLSQRIKKYYEPGIKFILCSDGRVFSDVVGMTEKNVTDYQKELDLLIENLNLSNLSTFNLDDHYRDLNFNQMRDVLMKKYGNSLEHLKLKIKNGSQISATPEEQEVNRMYRGITRFLFEDSLHPGQTKSRTSIQKEARLKAYEVIRRSNAWSELIAERFPESVRLSIHPQSCGSKKLGIRLIANECWMTPWHGVAVETKGGYVLLKRSDAESLSTKLVFAPDGRPSHFKLKSDESIHGDGVIHGV